MQLGICVASRIDDIDYVVRAEELGFGPRSLALAGKHGAGAVVSIPPYAPFMEQAWAGIEAGAFAIAGLHYTYDQFRNFGREPSAGPVADVWEEYRAVIEATPEERRHLRVHAGLDQVMILPPIDPRYEVLETVGTDILPSIRTGANQR